MQQLAKGVLALPIVLDDAALLALLLGCLRGLGDPVPSLYCVCMCANQSIVCVCRHLRPLVARVSC